MSIAALAWGGGYLLTGFGLIVILVVAVVLLWRQRREWKDLDQDRIERHRRRRGDR